MRHLRVTSAFGESRASRVRSTAIARPPRTRTHTHQPQTANSAHSAYSACTNQDRRSRQGLDEDSSCGGSRGCTRASIHTPAAIGNSHRGTPARRISRPCLRQHRGFGRENGLDRLISPGHKDAVAIAHRRERAFLSDAQHQRRRKHKRRKRLARRYLALRCRFRHKRPIVTRHSPLHAVAGAAHASPQVAGCAVRVHQRRLSCSQRQRDRSRRCA